MNVTLTFAPLIPLPLLWLVAALAALVALIGLIARHRGGLIRTMALGLFVLALANPSFIREEREPLPNVLAVVLDRSASQNLEQRNAQTDAIRTALEASAKNLNGIETRFIDASAPNGTSDGTELFTALARGMADVAPERVAGAVLVTDGRVHDIPEKADNLGFSAPVHALVTGRENERDRSVIFTLAPRFGITGKSQTIAFRVNDTPTINETGLIDVVIRRDGEEIRRLAVRPGEERRFDVPIVHAGPNVVEVEAETVPNELSTLNNRAGLTIEGVREKLRVLLVSGEPHSGERTWRNLLKSDANVDLVHFTILRPPEKQDGTPINELSLIAFPTRELFSLKINEFDLIIFDRYARQGILPSVYFDNIAQYVKAGGAVLVAAGPDYAAPGNLYETPLASVLPAEPEGGVVEQPFRAKITDPGQRHPVTRALPGGDSNPPRWSEWFRIVQTRIRGGDVLMSGPRDLPLLVLNREDKGRVAVFLSDHVWLWARGFEGGGPHVDLLRRLAHWLMKEPDLEEEALRLSARGGVLTVERQTMKDTAQPVTLTLPSGATHSLTLQADKPGLWRATFQTPEMGLHQASDGILTALTNVGPANPREMREITSTTEWLKPLADATRGSVRRVEDAAATPRLMTVASDGRMSGSDWIGIRAPESSVVRGLDIFPIFAGLIGLALLVGAAAVTWAREGR